MVKLWLQLKMFKRYCFWKIVFCFMLVYVYNTEARYVRKYIEPNFFIPKEDAFNKPEKLPPIMKLNYDKPVKKISRKNNFANEEKLAENENIFYSHNKPMIAVNKFNIPSYQLQFDDYSKDIEHINKYGYMPANENLEKILAEMNSNKLFKVYSNQNYKKSDVTSDFERILDQVVKN